MVVSLHRDDGDHGLGDTPDTLTIGNHDGLDVTIVATGASIASLRVPMGHSKREVVLGYPNMLGYADDPYYIGATAGRFANRIANATTIVAGDRVDLDANEGVHCLHGGAKGLNRQEWTLASNERGDAIVCTLRSPHGEQGFPGTVDVAVTYRLEGPRSLAIDFYAETDRETILSLANHAYFNLGDEDTIDDHTLLLHADEYTPADESLIPTGEIASVDGTAFDLREPTPLGGDVPRKFDTNFIVRGGVGLLREVAVLASRSSGLAMRVETTQAGLQVYTGDYLGEPFHPRQGVCLEAQNLPNAPNEPEFPSARLLPGEPYRHTTVLTFDSRNS